MIEMINTATAVGTFFVLGAAAIAALIQISHLRGSNQLQMIQHMYRRLQDPVMHRALDFAYFEMPQKIASDPSYLQDIVAGKHRYEGSPFMLALWYDEIGFALRRGYVDAEAVFELGAGANNIVRSWTVLLPVIEALRQRVPSAFANFEYAVDRARAWLVRYPTGKLGSMGG